MTRALELPFALCTGDLYVQNLLQHMQTQKSAEYDTHAGLRRFVMASTLPNNAISLML